MPNKLDVPDSIEVLKDIGAYIMQFEALQNAFLYSLVNRIARTIITSKAWNDPWAVFNQGYMEFGETVEEIFVNIAKPYTFDPSDAEETLYKREIPDVRAAFHTMNWQKYYPVTVSQDQLRQAFLSWDSINDLTARIVESLYTGMKYDEFVTKKYMLARCLVNGELYTVETSKVTGDGANPKMVIAKYRQVTNDMLILSTQYNMAHVYNSTPVAEQVIIMPNEAESILGVDVLASAFQLNQVDYIGGRIPVDSFELTADQEERLKLLFGDKYEAFTGPEKLALQQVNAVKVAKDWFMVFDNLQNVTQDYNGKGLYWNYFLHAWKTFSVSPFANAVAFTSQTSEITGVTVSPATANVAQGSQLQLTATVAGTGLYEKTVTWSITGATKTGTKIDGGSGMLTIAADEPTSTEVTVTATAVDGQTGTATISVVARS